MPDDVQTFEQAGEAAEQALQQAFADEEAESSASEAEGDKPQPEQEPRRYKIRHRDREHEVTEEELINLAEQGFDYQQKRQRDAQALREYEQFKPLVDYIRSDPQFAAYLAAYDQLRARGFTAAQAQAGAAQQTGLNLPPELIQDYTQLKQQVAEIKRAEEERETARIERQMREELERARKEFEGVKITENRIVDRIEHLLDDPVMQVRAAVLLEHFDDIRNLVIQQYLNSKTRGGPPVQGTRGASPANRHQPPQTMKEADQAAIRFLEQMARQQ
ncbi:MAG TPA: hypothetical protein VF226_04850 [Hyphomicrobiaceae bacterium]